jgi:penicillin-binding protein 1A
MKASQNGGNPTPQSPSPKHTPKRILLTILATLAGLAVCGVLVVVFALAMAYPNLPALDTLTDYRPKMPLRITS